MRVFTKESIVRASNLDAKCSGKVKNVRVLNLSIKKTLSFLFFGILLFSNKQSLGQIDITTLGGIYSQSFNSLSNTAGSTTNNLSIFGWSLNETGLGTRDNEQYAVDNGGSNTGDMYSYGAAGATDRALGGLRSGTLIPVFGVAFTNNTGTTVTTLTISYTGEQWRLGTAARTDQLDFQYSLNATSLTTGSWTDVNSLDFVGPNTGPTIGALDGNAAANKTVKNFTITGLSIANGSTFWFRWTETDASGADDGLSIDDFSLVASAPPGVIPLAQTNVTSTSAQLNGTVSSNGAITTSIFNFGTSVSYGANYTATQSPLAANAASAPISYTVTSLTPNTQYFYRPTATNSAGTTTGTGNNFYTLAETPPAPSVSNPTPTTLDVTVSLGTNPGGTQFAVHETTTGLYVQTSGGLAAGVDWFSSAGLISVSGLTASTTYGFHVKARNFDNLETSFGGAETGTTLAPSATTPLVNTTVATLITNNSASSGGYVYSDGGDPVTDRGVVYDVNPVPTVGVQTGSGTGTFTTALTGLLANTLYYYRAYATNGQGTGYGSELTFVTQANVPAAPTVNNATTTSLNVTVNANSNTSTTEFAIRETGGLYVQTDGSLSAAVAWDTEAGWGTMVVTGLTQGTTYGFAVKARNLLSDETTFGATASGTTLTLPTPTVTTTAVTGITTTSATSGGDVIDQGGSAVLARGVAYGTATNPTIGTSDGTGTGTYVSALTPLTVNTRYYYRAYATNTQGTDYGLEDDFYTLANVPAAPTVNNPASTSLNVTINPNGNPANTEFAIQTNGGLYVQADGSLGASPAWYLQSTKVVTGLSTGTTYGFWVQARNGDNIPTAFGGVASGTTIASACTQPLITKPSDVSYCNGTNVPTGTLTWSSNMPSGLSWTNSDPAITLGTGAAGSGTTLPTFTATNAGSLPATATITIQAISNADGCTSTATFTITVNASPSITIGPSAPPAICQGQVMTLTASGSSCTNSPFAGVMTGKEEVPPNASGGKATFTGTYNAGTGMMNVNIAFSGLSTGVTGAHIHSGATGVNGPIIVDLSGLGFPGAVTSGTFSQTFAFPSGHVTNFNAGNTYFNIHTSTFPGGEVRGQIIPCTGNYLWNTGATTRTIIVTQTGTYSVTGYNDYGCSSVATTSVQVNPLPNVSISGPSSVCAGSFIDLTGSPVDGDGGVNVIWSSSAPGVANVDNNGSVMGVSSGIATITYQYTDINGCASSTTKRISVNPTPSVTISGNTAVCQNSPPPVITFTGSNGTAPYVFKYTVNFGPIQTVTSTSGNTATVSVSTSTPGLYTYCLSSVSDANGCSQPEVFGCVTVHVRTSPTGTITGTTSVCQGAPSPLVTFVGANGTHPYTFTYTINGTGTATVSGGAPTSTVSVPTGTPGIFVYKLVSVSDATGCAQTQNGTATITVTPPPNSNAGPDQAVFPPSMSATMQANTPTPPQVGTWSVVSGPNTSSSQFSNVNDKNAVFTALATGTYILRWTVTNPPCTPGSDDMQLTVSQQQSGDILGATNTRICKGSGTSVDIDLGGAAPFTGVFNITLQTGSGASSVFNWTAATNGISGISVPAANLTNTGAANASYLITWQSLTDANGSTITAPSPLLTGSVVITVEPVADIAAVADRPNLCNNSAETITVTNPNGVGGTYYKVVNYGAFVTGGTATLTNQAYGPFTETLFNSSTSAQTVTYTFTPVSPGTLGCVGTSTTLTITVQPAPSVVCPGNVVTSTSAGTCSATVTGLAPTFGPAGCNGGSTTVTYTVTGATTRSGVADASGSFNKGVSTVKYTVTDPSGSVVSCTFSVTVNDMQAPSISCPATATRSTNTGICTWLSPNSNLDPTFSDNCTGTTIAYTSTGAGVVPSTGATLSGTTFNRGVTVITWKATDAAGNSSSCTFTVTVQDTEKPAITSCPTSTTRPATLTPTCGYVVSGTEFDVQATDNCPATTVPGAQKVYTLTGQTSGTGTNTLAGKVLNLGATMVTWLVTDANGNTNACTFTVTVQDVNAPAITCPGNATRSTNPNVCTYRAMNTEFDATITDNCAGPNPAPARTYTLSGATTAAGAGTLSGTLFNTGTTTVSWLATDGSGNTSTCSFTVIVTDNQTPVITCNGNRVVPTDPLACTYTHPAGDLTWNASVTENCGVVVLSYTLSGATTNTLGLSSLENQVFNKGVTLVTYTGKDVAGNSATCSFTVAVFDNQAPVINNCGTLSNTVRNTDQGVCTWMAGNTGGRNIDVAITENCPYTVTYTLTGVTTMTAMPGTLSNTLFNKGVTTVNVTVADGTFTTTCSFTVTVNDNQLPLITTCPGNQIKSTDNNVCTYTAKNQEFDVVATDNCGMVPTNRSFTVTGATTASGTGTLSGTVFNKGTTIVTWNVMDASGGTATPCTFTVRVNDTQAPSVTPIPDQTLNTGGPGCQTVMPDYTSFVRGLLFDNCGTASLTIIQQSPNQPGTTVVGFGGTRVVAFFVTDGSGNTSTVSFQLLLRDQTKPTALCKPATVFLDANGVATVTVADVDNGSFDNCTQVTMSVSPTTFTCANTNTTNTVVLTVTDANGNVATCTANVTVKDNIKPTVTCPGSITLYKNEIACTTVIPDLAGTATATDNCGVVTRTQSPSAGTIIAASVTQTLVTITATDASGNTATCTVLVLHKDTIKPFFVTFPGNLTVTSNSVNASGGGNTNTCSQIVNWASPPFGDNCLSVGPVVVVSRTHAPGNSFPVGTTLVVYVIRDAAGNTQTGSFTVTVIDNTKPTITCPGSPFTATTTGSGCTATVSVPTPANADNCGVATVTSDHPSDQYPIGTTVVTWTVTDVNGNTNSCSRQVIVTDRGKPEMTCPASITISPNTAGCVASATIAAPSPVTDCSGPVTITYAITGAGASGTSTGTGAVGSRIFNVGTTNITYTATDAAGNTATCVTTVTVVNNLTGSISGTSTVVQNSGTTTAVVFTGTGGTTPYLFTYTITSNGNTNTYTVPTVSSNPSTSVAQSNAVLGVYVYKLIGVTDFYGCSGVITSQNTATVTVVSGPPDFTPTVDIASLSFTTPGVPRDFLVNINEISQLSPSLGAVQFRLVKPTAFTITYSTISGVSNVFGPQANNNSDWTFTEDAFFITVTLKHPAAQIPANSFSRIGFTITRKVGVAQNTSQNLTVTIVNGSGGDNNNSNNTSNTVVTAQ